MDIDKLVIAVDLHATCGKIANRFRRRYLEKGQVAAMDYLEKMVKDKKLSEKGLERVKRLLA